MSKDSNKLIIGSRDSQLALIQTYWVRDELLKHFPELEIEVLEMSTKGDQVLDVALSKVGDKGLFTQELEDKLLDESIDLAVHSMKDLPTTLPDGLEIACTSEREDRRDVVVFSKAAKLAGITSLQAADDLAATNKDIYIGTSSLRRIAQLRARYPHIKFVDIRGNLNTRLAKLDGSFDYSKSKSEPQSYHGIVLAAAGIKRLAVVNDKFANRIDEYLDPSEILPAIGQGALAIEIKADRNDVREMIRKLNSDSDELAIQAERSFLRSLEGGCQVPIGVYSELEGDQIKLKGFQEFEGRGIVIKEIVGLQSDAEELGKQLANQVIA